METATFRREDGSRVETVPVTSGRGCLMVLAGLAVFWLAVGAAVASWVWW